MKKNRTKILSLLLVTLFIFFAVASGSSSSSNNDTGNGKNTAQKGDTQKETKDVMPVDDGDVLTSKNSEFYIEYSNVTYKVTPPNPASYYRYYEADDGSVYVDVCFAYKNLASNDVDADEIINATLTYAGNYSYTGFTTIEEDNRGDFTYTNIRSVSPLSTEYIHYLFELPEEAYSSGKSIVVDFQIDGNYFTYTVR